MILPAPTAFPPPVCRPLPDTYFHALGTTTFRSGLTNAAKFCKKGYIMVDLQVRMRPVSRQFVEDEVRSSQWARQFFAKQGHGASASIPATYASNRLDIFRMLRHATEDTSAQGHAVGGGRESSYAVSRVKKQFQPADDKETQRALGIDRGNSGNFGGDDVQDTGATCCRCGDGQAAGFDEASIEK